MAALLPVNIQNVNYQEDKAFLDGFFRGYKETITGAMGDEEISPKYDNLLQNVVDREQSVIVVDLNDLLKFEDELEQVSNRGIVNRIIRNTKHYVDITCDVIDSICASKQPTNADLSYKDSVLDVIIRQRSNRDNNRTNESEEHFPPSLTRR
ncbi:hypothetical protein MBANPS3_003993 [Mucor bainieri]